jgi:acyl-CoA thioester hydrolase
MSERSKTGKESGTRGDNFRFCHPIEVRYRDVDAQRHVNSAVYFSYLEQARANYLQQIGLWSGEDFDQIGIILAEQSCSYRAPIYFGQPLEVGVRAQRLGNKSMHFEYVLRHPGSGQVHALATTVLVAYSYDRGESIEVPAKWRRKITAFEGGIKEQQ